MTIQLRRSNTSGNVPSGLQDGQVAFNQADDILFSRRPDGTIRRTLLPKRYGVANAAFQVRAYDTYVGVASLSASRIITLPAAANYPVGHLLTVADESGLVTASITVGIAVASGTSDTVNGASNLLFTTPYFGAILVSDGVSKWTALILGAGGSGSSVLYTPQLLTAAQQRQALSNLALSATNLWMTEIQAAANKGSYFGLLDGIADGFADTSGIDLANAQNVNIQNGTVVNQANDPNTKALVNFSGANNSTTPTDVVGHTVTAQGTAKLTTTPPGKFFASCLALDGSAGVGALIGPSSDFAGLTQTGIWTIETWYYPTATTGAEAIFGSGSGSGAAPQNNVYRSGTSLVLDNGSSGNLSYTSVFTTANQWYKVEQVNNGGTLYVFVNGTLLGTGSAQNYGTPDRVRIGNRLDTGYPATAYFGQTRVSIGIARHTTSYTPETSALTTGSSGALILPSINYALQSVPLRGSIRIRAKATADTIAPNTNFIASLSRTGTLGGTSGGLPNSLDVTLAQTALLPDGYAHYEANEVDLTGLAAASILKGSLRTVGTTLGVVIDGWRIRAA